MYAGRMDLDLDEVFSVSLGLKYPVGSFISPSNSVLMSDAHPPLHYLLTAIWMKMFYYPLWKNFHLSRELIIRIPGAVFSTAAVWSMAKTGEFILGRRFGLMAAIMAATASFSVQIAHQARMYPLMEMLAAVSLWISVTIDQRVSIWHVICLAVLSAMLMLTHYSASFFLLTLWGSLIFRFPNQTSRLIVGLAISLTLFAWWIPALIVQFAKEASAQSTDSSTGAIMAFCVYQFFSGDRTIEWGSVRSAIDHIPIILSTIVCFFLIGFAIIKETKRNSGLLWISSLWTFPILMNWIATFFVQRVFNASHYAICALPAFILTIASAVWILSSYCWVKAVAAVTLFFLLNFATFGLFIDREVRRPWTSVGAQLKEISPQVIYIYPVYMGLPLSFYAHDWPLKGLPQECSKEPIRIKDSAEVIVLIVSHDRGEGKCFVGEMEMATGVVPEHRVEESIDIYIYRSVR